MPATFAPSVADLRAEFETILATVLGEEGRRATVVTMERRLLRQVLALGHSLLTLFLASRAAATAQGEHQEHDGVRRPYHSGRSRHYLSIFGPLVFVRPSFHGRGVDGLFGPGAGGGGGVGGVQPHGVGAHGRGRAGSRGLLRRASGPTGGQGGQRPSGSRRI